MVSGSRPRPSCKTGPALPSGVFLSPLLPTSSFFFFPADASPFERRLRVQRYTAPTPSTMGVPTSRASCQRGSPAAADCGSTTGLEAAMMQRDDGSSTNLAAMSLRLLPAIVMDNDDDDDGNFTNWMRSYWGHGSEGRDPRDRKRSFRRPARSQVTDRRASLPCVSQLDAMRLSRLHAGAVGAASTSSTHAGRPGSGEENRPHPRARRTSSDDIIRARALIPENSSIPTIPELTESLEKRLSLGKNHGVSLNEDDCVCLICYEELRSGRAGLEEVHCTHRFHREASRRLENGGRPRSSSSAAADCDAWRAGGAHDEGHGSSTETGCLVPQRQFSLRRHR
ncbi:hypothetical protein CRUP_015616 [Coryphaenoides rupestris]|nr:hypothetical protein CRUP_015616 [Coryphaenoides rupestris]